MGSIVTSDGGADKEIKRGVAIAKTAFRTMQNVSASPKYPDLSGGSKLLFLEPLLYAKGTWTITGAMKKLGIGGCAIWAPKNYEKNPLLGGQSFK